MKLQKMIRDFRALNGLTQEELGKRIGVSKAYIGMLEKGIDSKTKKPVNPSLKTLHNLAIAMGYNPEEFYSILDEDTKVKMPKLPHGAQIKKVPMLGYAAAGHPLEDLNQDVFYVDIENKYDVDFCITVSGDSMTGANIYDGDIVFIKKTSTVSNGQIACIQIDREKVCLKRFYKTGDTVQLISENPKYPPMLFTSQNCESLQILGLAIIKQSEVK